MKYSQKRSMKYSALTCLTALSLSFSLGGCGKDSSEEDEAEAAAKAASIMNKQEPPEATPKANFWWYGNEKTASLYPTDSKGIAYRSSVIYLRGDLPTKYDGKVTIPRMNVYCGRHFEGNCKVIVNIRSADQIAWMYTELKIFQLTSDSEGLHFEFETPWLGDWLNRMSNQSNMILELQVFKRELGNDPFLKLQFPISYQ